MFLTGDSFMKQKTEHQWHFIQKGGLIQVQISTIDDILNLKNLDPKMWTALSCPVNGLEFCDETLKILDSDNNGRVRVKDILSAVEYIKKYFSKPEIILEPKDSILFNAISNTPFENGKIPSEAFKSISESINKKNTEELTLTDICTAIDIFRNKKNLKKEEIKTDCICNADSFDSFSKVKDKIDDFFLKCSLIQYDSTTAKILSLQNECFLNENKLSDLPLASYGSNKPLPLCEGINPVWKNEISIFNSRIIQPLFGTEKKILTEDEWNLIKNTYSDYENWCKSSSDNSLLQCCKEFKKMILYRRDFLELLKNFVSFENFYDLSKKSIFQCGTLYIDGRSCELCFKIKDISKHSTMAALSQCFLIYCDCTNKTGDSKMQIAALISDGTTDNILIGRNGMFIDRQGNDWDATIVKIIENPVSIKQAFWAPYKKLSRLIQEKLAKSTNDAETNMMNKMSSVVDNPKSITNSFPAAKTSGTKTDVGTVAALSVAFTGLATVVGGVLDAFFGLGWWIPVGIAGLVLAISLPSMLIAWRKLKQRNIAPILDANGWAINGNIKITALLGTTFTHLPLRPASAFLSKKDIFADKKSIWKSILLFIILIIIIAGIVFLVIKNPGKFAEVCNKLKTFGKKN